MHKLWLISLVTMAAFSGWDAASSRGLFERDPMLRGPNHIFSERRAIDLKTAGFGLSISLERPLIKNRRAGAEKIFTLENFGCAAAYGIAAAHNETVPGARHFLQTTDK